MSAPQPGLLVLEDGSMFRGRSLGADGEYVGPVVFYTGMTGHQEVLSDPAFAGRMVAFTCPHVGNVGVNAEDEEAARPAAGAVLARKISETPSNWRAEGSLPDWLRAHCVPALSAIDTRRLTLLLRAKGPLCGALSTVDPDPARLLEVARAGGDGAGALYSYGAPYPWTGTQPAAWDPDLSMARPHAASAEGSPHVVVLDLGAKRNLLRHLVRLGARVTVAPGERSAAELLDLAPDGLVVAGGPADPARAPGAIEAIRGLVGRVPLLGVGGGHLLVGLALGARTVRLGAGHHGANHPVCRAGDRGAVTITAQAHDDALDPASLAALPVEVTEVSMFDGSVEGLRHREWPVWSVQYQPEASPGPHDALGVLGEFVAGLRRR
jgi:carbamoyl-phosphate synthase small subunit